LRQAEVTRTQLQTKLEQATQELEGLRESDPQLTAELHDLRSHLADQRGRLASLEALQQAALGRSRAQVGEWLKQRKLSGQPRLAELISVTAGWERAVETVLGYHLEAVCVDRFADDAEEFASLAGGSLSFVEKAATAGTAASGSLLAKVRSPLSLDDWLGQVRTADDLPTALAMRSRLDAGESVITRDGLWFGRHWLRVIRGEDERAGVLARAQELKHRQAELAVIEREVAAKTAHQERAQRRRRELEAQREELQDELNQAHAQEADLRARQQSARDRLQQLAQRTVQLNAEIVDLDRQLASAQSELQSVQSERQAALAGVQALESRRKALQSEREALRGHVEDARARAKQDAETRHGLALKFESQRSTRDSTRQNLERVQAQLLQMDTRRRALQQAIEDAQAPMRQQEAELTSLLQRAPGWTMSSVRRACNWNPLRNRCARWNSSVRRVSIAPRSSAGSCSKCSLAPRKHAYDAPPWKNNCAPTAMCSNKCCRGWTTRPVSRNGPRNLPAPLSASSGWARSIWPRSRNTTNKRSASGIWIRSWPI